jgi:hypothetical protein
MLACGAGLVIVGLSGCGRPKSSEFLHTITVTQVEWDDAASNFLEECDPEGKRDVARVKAAYQRLSQATERMREKIKNLELPPLNGASDLHAAAQQMYRAKVQMFREDFTAIMRLFDRGKMNVEDFAGKLLPLASRLSKRIQRELAAFEKAQAAFARTNNLDLD